MVMEARLKTEFWVKAMLRHCAMEGGTGTVARKGELSAGSVLVKVNKLNGMAFVLSQSVDMDGKRVWLRATGKDDVAEVDCDQYIARSASRDPDIWVVEIEDRQGRHFLTEPVEGERSQDRWPMDFQ